MSDHSFSGLASSFACIPAHSSPAWRRIFFSNRACNALSSAARAEAIADGADPADFANPEAIGDYLAGPNHILPTGGTARFSYPLGVYDFLKRTSVLEFSPEAFGRYGPSVTDFARMEGLTGHGLSASVRISGGLPEDPDRR